MFEFRCQPAWGYGSWLERESAIATCALTVLNSVVIPSRPQAKPSTSEGSVVRSKMQIPRSARDDNSWMAVSSPMYAKESRFGSKAHAGNYRYRRRPDAQSDAP